MRRILLIFCLMLAAMLLVSCTPQPDLTGKWQTAPDDTLCATLLWLNGDGTFLHMQVGRTSEGTWALKDTRLTLTVTPLHEMDSGGAFFYTLDKAAGTLNSIDGLRLHHEPAPDIEGYWMSFSDDAPKRVSLHLMESGLFALQIYDKDLPLNTLDGWETFLTGRWSLSGLHLTLRSDGGPVLTYRLNADASMIETDSGILLKNYLLP